MSLEESVREACSSILSVRANERKKGAEKLKDFLTRNAVPSLLTNNTLKKSGCTWTYVFDAINDYIMKEMEKHETAKTFYSVTVPLSTSLLHLCVAGANKGCAYIKCDRIVTACLTILNDSRLTKAIGDAYLSLLYKHVLPNEYYMGYISPSDWESLLDVCIKACLTKSSSLDDLVKIRLLGFVIKKASCCCQFAIHLRDSLSKLSTCLQAVLNDKKVQEFALEIIILLMEALSVDYRLTMCEFSENILAVAIKFYESSMPVKKKFLMFKLLRIIILVHHPLGKNHNMSPLASDWDTWKRLLHSMLEIVCIEISYTQKSKKTNEDLLSENEDFNFVAASAFNQTFQMLEDVTVTEAGSSAKKQKLSANKNKSFSDMLQEFHVNCDPWLGIVLMYVRHYIHSITFKEHLMLLTVIEIIVSNNDKNTSWDFVEELTCLAIKNLVSLEEYKENSQIFMSLLTLCVRNATIGNAAQKAIHAIIQVILNSVPLKYKTVQSLLVSYVEKGMPVNNHSLKTLNVLYYKFYRKSCYLDVRKRCLAWLTKDNVLVTLDVEIVKEFLLRLLSNENFSIINSNVDVDLDAYDVLFTSIDKSILYSEFEYKLENTSESKRKEIVEAFEINNEMYILLLDYLEQNLSNASDRLLDKSIKCVDFVSHLSLTVAFLDSMLKCKLKTRNEMRAMSLFKVCQDAIRHVFVSLTQSLKSECIIREKVSLLKCVQNIFLSDYDIFFKSEIRKCIEETLFHMVNNVIRKEIAPEENDIDDDDIDFSSIGLKHNCIYLLASYCTTPSDFTDEIVTCVLDKDLFNFTLNIEIECALRCIDILNEVPLEHRPIGEIFSFMQDMCRATFRNTKATRGILTAMSQMLEPIWSHRDDMMKQNCLIMVKSYLQRCSYMPPNIAALVYKCAAKVLHLNQRKDPDLCESFKETLISILEGDNHCIRLYCCQLLKITGEDFCQDDLRYLADHLSNMFIINVPNKAETILKDESNNRTLTVLHCFYALGITNRSLIHDYILKLLLFQNDTPMDKKTVKKVINDLTEQVTCNKIEVYMNNNILNILNYWFKNNKGYENLPLYLFGLDTLDDFVLKHIKWLVSTDILWHHKGNVSQSNVLKRFVVQAKKSPADIVEMSFCNIISLCLPYVVCDKYGLKDEKLDINIAESALRMDQTTRQILKTEKWCELFLESLGDLILVTASHICDSTEASELFQLPLQECSRKYTYSKRVFSGILKYFGELINQNIMQYLCNNESLIILNILFKLWDNIIHEKVFDFKALSLHAYLLFVHNIPLGHKSDAVLCNFLCSSITCAVKDSQSKGEVKIFVKALTVVIERMIQHSPKSIEKIQISTLSKIVSTLNIKIEQGYAECNSLLKYLTKDLKQDLDNSVHVIDCINLMTADEVDSNISKTAFLEKLEAYLLSLRSVSHNTLVKLFQFLKENKLFIKELYTDFCSKGFSEHCRSSLVHQVVSALTNILKTNSDDKISIEACNCLAEIGSYDMKTLVMVPPADTQKITDLSPKQYFAALVVESLFHHIFDEDATVSKKVIKALTSILKFREGRAILDIVDIDKGIIQPLSTVESQISAEYKIDDCNFNKYSSGEYWVPNKGEPHFEWVARITMALLDLLASSSNYVNSLVPVCAIKPKFCQKIMPALMGLIISSSSDAQLEVLGEQVRQVFKYIWQKSYEDNFEDSEVSNSSKESWKTRLSTDDKMMVEYMLNMVNFVRIQSAHYKTYTRGRRPQTDYLKLEYERVSWAAAAAEQHWAAVYYGELSAVAEQSASPRVMDIFRKCFVAIGEMDAIDGCGTAHLTREHEKRKHLISTGQYVDALVLHDIALSRGAADARVVYGAVTSLHKWGMHHLALQYIRSYPENDDLDDIKYECLAYLGDWSDFVDTSELEAKSKAGGYEQNAIIKAMRYACLKDCITIQPVEACVKLDKPLNRAKLVMARMCQNLNMENCQNVYRVVAYLHLLRDIENYFSVKCEKSSITSLLENWKVENLPYFNDFKHLETLILQRSLILEHIAKNDAVYLSDIHNLQLEYAELGLKNDRIQMAQRLVAAVKSVKESQKVILLESQISWAKGHKDIALSLLRSIVSQDSEDPRLTAMSLRQYGLWMSECKRETSSDIHAYLQRSLETLSSNDDMDTRLKVYYDIAKFADDEYKQVVIYMKSSVFENKVKCVESLKGTAKSLKTSQQAATKNEEKLDIHIKYRVNTAFGVLDDAEIAYTRSKKDNFLNLAMRYYLLSLKESDDNDLSVFRVISLWLDNPYFEFEDRESGNFGDLLQKIPSWKFIPVLPQLAPRLSDDDTPFANILRLIMMRCAIEHPHHTLPLLFSLKNSDKGEMPSPTAATGAEPRVLAAAALVQRVAKHNTLLATIVAQMEELCDATISFAYCVPESKDLKPQAVPRNEAIARLRDLHAVPVPTDTVPVRKNCDYTTLNTLSSFEKYFELVGGINFPKKISCLSSDGKKRILLIKGKDDMRQDAVMQQVFTIVNTLLEKNPITHRNKLLIRTYKVVPMSRRSGVLQWCEGTMPIGLYLVAAHTKYRPEDITPAIARNKLKLCHDNRKPNEYKVEVFKEILKVFKPVFHHFFTEHYLDPVTWYERRLAYTRSVATSSMVGYILGIGDRHVQNILIDKTTAEVIHIDFGIAFDQGKTLQTPETVPFRLTQDFIAGFGSCGIEGIFRRCCEKTLQLLRDNQDTLLTILEVLLCDPLYLWIVSNPPLTPTTKPSRKNAMDGDTGSAECAGGSAGSSGLAARALLAVRGKLCGAEGEGGARGMSAEGHVAKLLRAATDPANLAKLFHGWQPYL